VFVGVVDIVVDVVVVVVAFAVVVSVVVVVVVVEVVLVFILLHCEPQVCQNLIAVAMETKKKWKLNTLSAR